MAHKGHKLRDIVRRTVYSNAEIAKSLKKTERTIYLWFENPDLEDFKIELVCRVINVDPKSSFPDINPVHTPKRSDVMPETADYWRSKYIEQLEVNSRLMQENASLKSRLMEFGIKA